MHVPTGAPVELMTVPGNAAAKEDVNEVAASSVTAVTIEAGVMNSAVTV